MNTADRRRTISRRGRIASTLAALTMLATSCIVDTPVIDSTLPAPTAVGGQPTDATEQPTAQVQVPPTAVVAPTSAPTPTPVPEPTATAVPEPTPVDLPPPLPTTAPSDNFVPTTVDAGAVSIPIGGTSFVLDAPRPILQLGGHTLIYLDADQMAEVDIFTPVADRDANVLRTYDDAIAYLTSQAEFGEVEELAPVTIGGLPTRVFSARTGIESADAERAFITDVTALKDPTLGWYPPKRFQLWIIDRPAGPLVVSAESLEDPGQFDEALALANTILSTLVIG